MNWETHWDDPFSAYLRPFQTLAADRRTRLTLTKTIKGIIASGSLICQRIPSHSPLFASVKDGAQRILRMATHESTQRSPHLDPAQLTDLLRSHAVAHLSSAPSDELLLIADGSDLRKPSAQAMPHMLRVRSLEGAMVNGYRTLNVIGLKPQHRGRLYHRLFSSKAPRFKSEPYEVQQALTTVSEAITPLKERMPVAVDNGLGGGNRSGGGSRGRLC